MSIRAVQDIVRSLRGRKDSPCLSFKTDYRTFRFTYSQVGARVAREVEALRKAGVRPGCRVVIWAPNSPQWVCSFLAVACLGAVAVPMDFRGSPDLVVRVARQVKPALAIIGDRMPAIKLGCEVARISPVWTDDCDPGSGDRPQPRMHGSSGSDLLEIIYTSGTTGRPKGVMLTHSNVISNMLSALEGLQVSSDDCVVSLLPLSHMFEQVGGLFAPLSRGASIVYLERLNRRTFFDALRRERPSFVMIVPRLLEMIKGSIELAAEQSGRKKLLDGLRRAAAFLPAHARRLFFPTMWEIFSPARFRCFVAGGAPLEPGTERFFESLGLPILQGYGLTETSPVLTFNTFSDRRIGSVGRPIKGVALRIASDGEILAKGPNITKGYYKDKVRTRELFKDGWLATGDLGFVDDDGFVHIKGRKKDLIVTSEGMNVYPEDVEPALNKVKGVRDSAVVGYPRQGSEQVHAVLLLGKDAGSAGAIVAKANASLPSYSRITGYTVWPGTEFPRTTTMKVKRFEVISFLEQRHGRAAGSNGAGMQVPRLFSLIARVTKRPLSCIRGSSNLTSDLGLSSLDRLELLALVEDELGVSLSDEVITPGTSVADLEKLVASRPSIESGVKFRPWLNSWPVRLIRIFLQNLLVFPVVAMFTRTAVYGIERLRGLRRPCLIVCNHASHFDTPVLLMSLPARLRERVCPVGMWEYFIVKGRHPVKQFLMWRLYDLVGIVTAMVPFPQISGFAQSMAYAGSLIDKGYSILVFPEGMRTTDGRILDFKGGVGMMAVNYGIPILPVRISGLWETLPAGRFWPRMHPSSIVFGKPFMVKSEDYREAADEIEAAVRRL